jgi:hypothetical protein
MTACVAGGLRWRLVQVFDSSLLRFAVGLTHSLDDRFKLPHKRMASLVSVVCGYRRGVGAGSGGEATHRQRV